MGALHTRAMAHCIRDGGQGGGGGGARLWRPQLLPRADPCSRPLARWPARALTRSVALLPPSLPPSLPASLQRPDHGGVQGRPGVWPALSALVLRAIHPDWVRTFLLENEHPGYWSSGCIGLHCLPGSRSSAASVFLYLGGTMSAAGRSVREGYGRTEGGRRN